MMSGARLSTVVLLLALWPAAVSAQGGPPLLTDDPDTPGPGHWEINLAMLLETSRLERRIEAPRLDVNYGVGRRIQLKFEMPWVRAHQEGERLQDGAGNAVVGVKWRFLGQEGMRVAWSIYPQFAFNTLHSSIEKGIVEDGRQFLFPTELTVEVAHVEINGEIGWNVVENRRDNWIFGASAESHVVPRLELLGELHGEQMPDATTELFANVGARPRLTRQLILLLAAGRTVHGSTNAGRRVYAYVGLQFNLPDQYSFKNFDGSRLSR